MTALGGSSRITGQLDAIPSLRQSEVYVPEHAGQSSTVQVMPLHHHHHHRIIDPQRPPDEGAFPLTGAEISKHGHPYSTAGLAMTHVSKATTQAAGADHLSLANILFQMTDANWTGSYHTGDCNRFRFISSREAAILSL